MDKFQKVKDLYAQYRNYTKQHIYLAADKEITGNSPKIGLINEIVALVADGESITSIAKELNTNRLLLYKMGAREKLQAEGRHLLDGIVILHRTMQELRNTKRYNSKLIVQERQRMKMLIYTRIAHVNRYYCIPLQEISLALGYRGDYLNKSLAKKGSRLYNLLKEYGNQAQGKTHNDNELAQEQTNPQDNRLEQANNTTGVASIVG